MNEMQMLQRHHDAQPAPSAEVVEAARVRLAGYQRAEPVRLRTRRPRRYVLAAAGVAAVAAAAVVVPTALGGDGGAKAYAVEREPGGDVKVTIREFTDAKGLQARLRSLGVNASITYLPDNYFCVGSRGTVVTGHVGVLSVVTPTKADPPLGDLVFRIHASRIKPGTTLVWTISFDKSTLDHDRDRPGLGVGVQRSLISGPVKPCVPKLFPVPGK